MLPHGGVLQSRADERSGSSDAREGIEATPGWRESFRGAGGHQERAFRQLLLLQQYVDDFFLSTS